MSSVRMHRFSVALWWIAIVATAISIFITLTLYRELFFPALLWDEWGEIEFYFNKGFASSVLCMHNHHIVILPKLVTHSLYALTNADPFYRGLSVLAVAGFLGGLLGYVSSLGQRGQQSIPRIVKLGQLAAALGFTLWLVAYQQLYWGMALYSYFSLLFGFSAVLLLDIALQARRGSRYWLCLALVMAVASTLSFSYGFAVWGALAMVLLLYRKSVLAVVMLLVSALVMFLGLRSAMPHCRPLSDIAPEMSLVDPLAVTQGLLSLLGSVWVHSFTPLLSLTESDAAVFGGVGLAILVLLSIVAWKASDARVFRLLVIGCWMVVGMLFLVAVGRNPADFALPNQMIARRFIPLSIFFWICLLAACARRAFAKDTSRVYAQWGGVYACAALFLLVTTLLCVNWISAMRVDSQYRHLTAVEMRLEVARVWVSPESAYSKRFANTLGILDAALLWDNVDEMRSRQWDFFRSFPADTFPATVTELSQESSPRSDLEAFSLSVSKSKKVAKGSSWTLSGTLSQGLPKETHLFFSKGDQIVGYGLPAAYPAFENTLAKPLSGFGAVFDNVFAGKRRLNQLLRQPTYWNGVGLVSFSKDEWHCEWRTRNTALCTQAE